MPRLCVLILFLAALPVFAQTADTPDAIIAQENAYWKSFANGDASELSKLLLPDFVSVDSELGNRDEILAHQKLFHEHCTLTPVKLVDPRVIFLTPDIATLVYHTTVTSTCGSHTVSANSNNSSVWLRRDRRWQLHLQTFSDIAPR
jgi:uncharacterized protein (TIGR02246 family)